VSLLNQVLQDLDARGAEVPTKPVLTPVDTPPPARPVEPPGRDIDWARIAVWGLASLLILLGSAYLFFLDPVSSPEVAPATVAVSPVAVVSESSSARPVQGAAAPGEDARVPAGTDPGSAAGQTVGPGGKSAGMHAGAQSPAEVEPVALESVEALFRGSLAGPGATAVDPAPGPPAATSSTLLKGTGYPARKPMRRATDPPAPVYAEVPLVAKRPSAARPPSPTAAAWLAEAKALWSQGRIASAEERLRKALAQRPRQLAARELLIALLIRGDRLGEAQQEIERGLARHPLQASLLLLKARLQAQRGQLLTAAATLEQSGLTESGDERALAMLASLYQQLGNYRESVAVYRRLVDRAPGTGGYWAGLGLGLEALGEGAMALRAYRRALTTPGLPEPVADYLRQRRSLLE
jgi:Tfp pilus assembly protein PilF